MEGKKRERMAIGVIELGIDPISRFRTLIDRILGMRMVYAQKSLNRQVSFEFLNRQMVWHAFTVSRRVGSTWHGSAISRIYPT